jgi:hypothetical protein
MYNDAQVSSFLVCVLVLGEWCLHKQWPVACTHIDQAHLTSLMHISCMIDIVAKVLNVRDAQSVNTVRLDMHDAAQVMGLSPLPLLVSLLVTEKV